MSYFLFLDDLRQPVEAFDYTKEQMFITREWSVVKTFEEFTQHIESHGVPDFISFDHDLHEEHYTPKEYWSDYEASKAYQDSQNYKEKTGLDCAKWLAKYCIANDERIPSYYVHSMNPVGADNIVNFLNSLKTRKAFYQFTGFHNYIENDKHLASL